MRSSFVLASLCAALSVASPLHRALHKKEYVYDITTEIVYVTVTMGSEPSSSSQGPHTVKTVKTVNTIVVEYTPSLAAVPVSTSIAPPPPSTTSTPPAPEPTIEAAPVVQVPQSTSTTPIPEPTTQAAAVVSVAAAPTQPAVVETPKAAPVVAVVSTSVAAAPVTAASPSDYQGTALYHHNQHRANHSANALSWSTDLASRALASANKCVFAHDMTQGGGGYGQNLAAYGSSDLSTASTNGAVADAITNQWYYGEAANMPYGVPSPDINGPEFLHFSAMLWKASTTVGCATVTCKAGTIFSMASLYTVCNYQSTGNILGEFDTQVTKPIGNAAIKASVTS